MTILRDLLYRALNACVHLTKNDTARYQRRDIDIERHDGEIILRANTSSKTAQLTYRLPCEIGRSWHGGIEFDDAVRMTKILRCSSKSTSAITLEHSDGRITLRCGESCVTTPLREIIRDAAASDIERVEITAPEVLVQRLRLAAPWCRVGEHGELARGIHIYFVGTLDGASAPAVVATDGHRLLVDGDLPEDRDSCQVLRLPGVAWTAVSKAIDDAVSRAFVVYTPGSDGDAVLPYLELVGQNRVIRMQLEVPSSQLPSWEGFVPNDEGSIGLDVVADRAAMIQAAKVVAATMGKRNANVVLEPVISRGVVRLRGAEHVGGIQVAREVPAELPHGGVRGVALNVGYLLDALAAIESSLVRIYQEASSLGAVRVDASGHGENSPRRAIVIMPIRWSAELDEQPEDAGTTCEAPAA